VVFADNDFGDLVRNKLFRTDGDRIVPGTVHISAALRDEFGHAAGGLLLDKMLTRLKRRLSPVPGPTLSDMLEMARRQHDDYLRDSEVRNLLADHYDADLALFPTGTSARLKVRLMGHALEQMKNAAASARTRLVVVVLPAKGDVLGLVARDVATFAEAEYSPRRLSATVTELAQAAAIDVVDLYELFRAREDYYFTTHNHWNNAGQGAAADHVYGRLGLVGGN
jgi:hypothetical protein